MIGAELQVKLIKLLLTDELFFNIYHPFIKPQHFVKYELMEIYGFMVKFKNESKLFPTPDLLLNFIKYKSNDADKLKKYFFSILNVNLKKEEVSFIKSTIVVKIKAMEKVTALSEIAKILLTNKEDLTEEDLLSCEDLWNKSNGTITNMRVKPLKEVYDEMFEEKKPEDAFRYNIPSLDRYSVRYRGTTNLFLAFTNVGKSRIAVYLAYQTIRQLKERNSKEKVVFLSTEDTAPMVLRNFASAYFERDMQRLVPEEKDIFKTDRKKEFMEYFDEHLVIKSWSRGVLSPNIMDSVLGNITVTGRSQIAEIILDSLDCCKANAYDFDTTEKTYNGMKEVMDYLDFVAREKFNKPVAVTVTSQFSKAQKNQYKAGANDKEVLYDETNIGGSFKVVQACSNAITLNQTPEQSRNNVLKLFLVKNKDGANKKVVTVKFYKDKLRVVDEGEDIKFFSKSKSFNTKGFKNFEIQQDQLDRCGIDIGALASEEVL